MLLHRLRITDFSPPSIGIITIVHESRGVSRRSSLTVERRHALYYYDSNRLIGTFGNQLNSELVWVSAVLASACAGAKVLTRRNDRALPPRSHPLYSPN
jgi:hypothetical protein